MNNCSKDENLTDQVENLNWRKDGNSELDQWLNTKFLDPYNIQIRYKWDRAKISIGADVVPVLEDQVMPVGNTILQAYLKPYEVVTAPSFMKVYPPKEFFFAGSVRYNSNGSVQLGIAEGGKAIILYDLNNYDPSNLPGVLRMLHTIHHEFGHILHQNKLYDTEYGQLSAGKYNGDWTSQSQQTALNGGFITPYSMSAIQEDFVEMISTLLVEGQEYFDSQVEQASEEGAAILRKKEEMVVNYYQKNWNIDFRELQNLVQQAIYQIVPSDPNDYIGEGLSYTSLTADPSTLATNNWSPSFLQVFNQYDETINSYNSNYRAGYVELYFDEDGKMKMRTRTNNTSTNSYYIADFEFNMSKDNGIITFSYIGPYANSNSTYGYSNARGFESSTQQLINYFKNHRFKFEWPQGYPSSRAKLVVVDDETNFVLGSLGELTN
ncbi:hypothetical protein GCM10023231_11240 [Olivibacter ginsenosidimutans]|uniref:Substrate import-associated zinc metallohydrolase lipoprotein n=2 Tax=Olivibacter ginsenosidimutans TaxID=1176537 RepID=A0ABP9ASP9_9SPHI